MDFLAGIIHKPNHNSQRSKQITNSDGAREPSRIRDGQSIRDRINAPKSQDNNGKSCNEFDQSFHFRSKI